MTGPSWLFNCSILFILLGCATQNPARHEDYFQVCNHPETGGTTIPFAGTFEKHTTRPECIPDVLYSWQSEEKINWNQFPQNPLTGGKYLYTWRTPVSTYAFGNIQIRLKLRKDIKFRWFIKNRGEVTFRCPADDQDNTVYVLTTTYQKVVSEYLICSPNVLESWSTHTLGAYYEAANEYDYIVKNADPQLQTFDAYGFGFQRKRLNKLNKLYPSDSYFVNWDGYKLKWGDDILRAAILSLKTPKHKQAGEIFYGKGIPGDPKKHFETAVESYFQLSQEQLKSTF